MVSIFFRQNVMCQYRFAFFFFQMNAFNLILATIAVMAHVVSGYYGGYYGGYYDDNEENDQIVGGFKAKRGSYQFLVKQIDA